MADKAEYKYKRVIGVALEIGEDLAYFVIAALLLVIAFITLGKAMLTLWGLPGSEGVEVVVLEVLDLLLLVFIVIELLFAVRSGNDAQLGAALARAVEREAGCISLGTMVKPDLEKLLDHPAHGPVVRRLSVFAHLAAPAARVGAA